MGNIMLAQGGFGHNTFKEIMSLDLYEYNPVAGVLTEKDSFCSKENYGYICAGKNGGSIVYGVDTRMDSAAVLAYTTEGGKISVKSRFAFEHASHGLHLAMSKNQKYLLACFAKTSEVYSLKLDENGDITSIADIFCLPKGRATVPRQESGPAPHQACFDRTGRHIFIPDTHTDRLYVMRFDEINGKMKVEDCCQIDGGEGPRHATVHPDNKSVYLLTEMGVSIYRFAFDENIGSIGLRQKISLVPNEYREKFSGDEIQAGEIVVSENGKFLLASTRNYFTDNGDDRIFSIQLDENTGNMLNVRNFSCGGRCPRMIMLDPAEKHLLIGNKDDNKIISIEYDKETGTLGRKCSSVKAVGTASMCFIDV